jgi:hypothetical protein
MDVSESGTWCVTVAQDFELRFWHEVCSLVCECVGACVGECVTFGPSHWTHNCLNPKP